MIDYAYNAISDLKTEITTVHDARVLAVDPFARVEVSDDCRELLESISKWKWSVHNNDGAKADYADIYNYAVRNQTPADPAESMHFIQVVEHHRRYKLQQAGSGEC